MNETNFLAVYGKTGDNEYLDRIEAFYKVGDSWDESEFPKPYDSGPVSGWGYKKLDDLQNDQLRDILKKLQEEKENKEKKEEDKFNIDNLTEKEKKALIEDIKDIIKKKRT